MKKNPSKELIALTKKSLELAEKRKQELDLAELFGEDVTDEANLSRNHALYKYKGKLLFKNGGHYFDNPDEYFEHMEKWERRITGKETYNDGYPK